MTNVEIPLTDSQATALKDLAQKRNVPLAELVDEVVEKLLTSADPVPWEERKRRASALAGCANSGLPDLATAHDDYLAEHEERIVSLAEIVKAAAEKLVRPKEAAEGLVRPVDSADWEERKRRALAAAGKFHSGTGDLSARHDGYFADAAEGKDE